MSELPDDHSAVARHAAHRARRQRRIYVGLIVMLAGYWSLAIAPDTPTHWLLPRVALGFGLLYVGAGLVLTPLIEKLLKDS